MSETWYPKARRRLAPASKIHGMNNPGKGIVAHSMVGYRYGAYSVLDNTVGPRGTVGWHFSVYQDGTVEQHAPLEAVMHHAGDWGDDNDGANGNGELIGIEHEGGYSPANEALTVAQRDASVALVRWIAQVRGWEPSRTGKKTLWEHHEVSNELTQCPSGRIKWQYYLLTPVQKPAETVSPPLHPDDPDVWYGLYDAVTGGQMGEYDRLPKTHPGWDRYEFRIRS